MKIDAKALLLHSILGASLLTGGIGPSYGSPVAISVTGKDSATFVVSNLANVTGFGGHFSTGIENGYGGENAECHFVSGTTTSPSANLILVCYDGYQSTNEHVNQFRVDLGPKKENNQPVISHATLTVSARGIFVEVIRIATSPYTSERKPYAISSYFPLRESSGFFKTGTIYYENDGNGVLSGDSSRNGTGYTLAVPVVR